MTLSPPIATVFGGTGFIGRYVVQGLAQAGYVVRVATRNPRRARFLAPFGAVGQIVPIRVDITAPDAVAGVVDGAAAAINLIGLLDEHGGGSFAAAHEVFPGTLGAAATAAQVARVIHVSAIGADPAARASYAASKGRGEAALRAACPAATILRPSIVFGPEDSFFNRFAKMAMLSPALPLIGGGGTRFQPVHVCDVAAAILAALTDPATAGRTYELGGPEVESFKALLQRMLRVIDRDRMLVPLPWSLARSLAGLAELVPGPKQLTRDQVELLRTDNVVAPGALTLADLGIVPRALDQALPGYLEPYRVKGRFALGAAARNR